MRFIGSKKKLLNEIKDILKPHLDGNEKSFVDLFAGSNVVGNYFAKEYQVITNDIMYFSYVLARGSLSIRNTPKFNALKDESIQDPLQFLSSCPLDEYHGDYVTEEYSPAGKQHRMYFTVDNAKRIDYCRNTIESWHNAGKLTSDEYFYLLSSLISAIPFVSNITGTYGAFLKKWDKRAFKPLTLEAPNINNINGNHAYNDDSINLLSLLKDKDIIYIDTPYNTRQYPSNYHVLENIAKWKKPALKGITGQLDLNEEKSDFAVKKKALSAMKRLLAKVNGKHVVISYSTDGIIDANELTDLIKQFAKEQYVEVKKIEYRKYKGKIHNNDKVYELLFYYQPKTFKKYKQQSLFDDGKISSSIPSVQNDIILPKGFIKSPLNYIGGKYKLLPQIFPYFPDNIHTFVDLFSGGANVGINITAQKIIFNDINTKINELFRYIQEHDTSSILRQIHEYINKYQLSKTNADGFKQFRDDYNKTPNPIALYTLVSYSFNYQFRFNNELKYNNPFGRNRSHFSKRMESNLIKFSSRLRSINASFTDQYFTDVDFQSLGESDFVYADPPYLITTGSYNDGNRGFVNWTEKQDEEILKILDDLDNKNVKFAFSNVLRHKGNVNKALIDWSNKYNVHHLNYSYSNSSHNTSHLYSDEVLITNY